MTVTAPVRLGSAEIVPLTPELADAAGRLFVTRLDELRADVPAVRPSPADEIASSLRWVLERWPGWAALSGGRLVGYFAGLGLDGIRAPGIAALVPEWAWAVDRDAPARLLADLYAAAADEWRRRGWLHHLVQVMPLDLSFDRELAWLGFGPCVMDAIRDLAPEPASASTVPADIRLRRATEADLEEAIELKRGLEAHVQASPTFLHRDAEDLAEAKAEVAAWLGDPTRRLWVAEAEGHLVAFVALSNECVGIARVVTAPGVVHIVGAYTLPAYRSRGVAEALVQAALSDARQRGYETAAVDFETANPLARRFWTRFFAPVCISYERFLDPRAGEAER